MSIVGCGSSNSRSAVKLLFVHEVNWRTKVIYEIHDYPELLSLAGHEVVFIDFPEGNKPTGLARFLDLRTQENLKQSRAHRGSSVEVRTPGRVFAPPLDRLFASITFIPLIYGALKKENIDAVVLYGVPTNGWQTIAIAKHFRVPVLFRAIDVAQSLRKSIFRPLIRVAEKYIYRNATWVSANNQALKNYCLAHGSRADSTSVDYPGLDLERFQPGTRSVSLMQSYGLNQTSKVVLFMGTLYRFAGIERFLKLFATDLRNNPSWKFLILGGGEAEGSIRESVKQLGLDHQVIMPGFIDYDELTEHLRLADVAINPFEPSLVTNCALPWKVVQYLACGLPVVSTRLDGLEGLVPEGHGVLYEDLDQGFATAVSNLLLDDMARRQQMDRARRSIETSCNWDTCLGQFVSRISHCLELS